MRKIWILVFLLVVLPTVNAATISGEIYDLDFTLVKNAIVTINTIPEQKIISEDGTYSFNVRNGKYTLIAKHYVNNVLVEETQEYIEINEEGDYSLDLILFPSDEDEFLFGIDDNYDEEEKIDYTWFIIGFLLLAIIILFTWKPKKKEVAKELRLDTNDSERVLDFIKKEGGRTTQKDIRKAFSLSEAKASLIITELEHKGKVTRVKKGRGNVIILNN